MDAQDPSRQRRSRLPVDHHSLGVGEDGQIRDGRWRGAGGYPPGIRRTCGFFRVVLQFHEVADDARRAGKKFRRHLCGEVGWLAGWKHYITSAGAVGQATARDRFGRVWAGLGSGAAGPADVRALISLQRDLVRGVFGHHPVQMDLISHAGRS